MLPLPMLARPDALPRGDYAYEVKWDRARAIVAAEDGFDERAERPPRDPAGRCSDGA